MANESLDGLSVVQQIDINQTLEEKIGNVTPVQELDINQTLEEKIGNITPVQQLDIASTLEERMLAMSVVLGVEDENNRNVIHHCGSSCCNQSNSDYIWIDKGFVKIIAQSNIEHSQIVI